MRGAVLYLAMILVMRGLGKRQLGEFQPFELAMTILLADVISAPMESVSVPLLNGLLPVGAMFTVHSLISVLSVKFDGVRSFLSGRPQVVIERGKIDADALDRLCLSMSDLLEGLRGAGFLDPTQVGTAIVEANGGMSAFPANNASGPVGMPLMLILNGRVQPANLKRTGRDEAWLSALLTERGLTPEQVLLASLDTGGGLSLQLRRGASLKLRAMAPEEVRW